MTNSTATRPAPATAARVGLVDILTAHGPAMVPVQVDPDTWVVGYDPDRLTPEQALDMTGRLLDRPVTAITAPTGGEL